MPAKNFSTNRIVLSDFNAALELVITLLKELIPVNSFLPPQRKILIQQMVEVDGGLSELEKRGLRDLAEQAGAVSLVLVEHTRMLSVNEALAEFV